MDHLTESLYLAVAEPPPTRIDVDLLIERENRMRRRRRLLAAGASGLAATVVVAMVSVRAPGDIGIGIEAGRSGTPAAAGLCAAVLPTPSSSMTGPDRGRPTSAAPETLKPPPTEPKNAAVARLSAELNRVLATALPGMSFADSIHPDCTRIQFEPDIYPALYYSSIIAKDSAGVGTIVVMVHHSQFVSMNVYTSRETRPDGTQIGWNADATPKELANRLSRVQVSVLRPDGTFLTLLSHSAQEPGDQNPARPTPPATAEQLIKIGTAPGLTLYP